MMKTINNLLLGLFLYLLSYLEGVLRVYISVTFFGLIATIVAGTDFEKLLVGVLSITPGIGLGKEGNFSVGPRDITSFFLIWGMIFTLLSKVANRFLRRKISLGKSTLTLFGLGLHLVSLVVFSLRLGFDFALHFVGLLFTIFILSAFFLGRINFFKKRINEVLE